MKNITEKQKRDGFYMIVTPEERNIINTLKGEYAINISQAFGLFLKQMLEKQSGDKK